MWVFFFFFLADDFFVPGLGHQYQPQGVGGLEADRSMEVRPEEPRMTLEIPGFGRATDANEGALPGLASGLGGGGGGGGVGGGGWRRGPLLSQEAAMGRDLAKDERTGKMKWRNPVGRGAGRWSGGGGGGMGGVGQMGAGGQMRGGGQMAGSFGDQLGGGPDGDQLDEFGREIPKNR